MDLSPRLPWPIGNPPFYFPVVGTNMSRGHPTIWSKDDVYKWVEWCVQEYSLEDIPLDKFSMNGKALMLLSKEDFKERAPNSGDILYTTLQKEIEAALCRAVVPQPYSTPFPFYPRPATYGPPIRHHTDSTLSQVYLRSDASPTPSSPGFRFLPIRPRTSPTLAVDSDRHSLSTSPRPQDTFPSPPQSASESDTSSTDNMPRVTRSPGVPKREHVDPTGARKEMELSGNDMDQDPAHMDDDEVVAVHTESKNGETHPKFSEVPKTLKLKNNKDCRLLWEFIGRLLTDPKRSYDSCIKWEDESQLIFRITNPAFLAYLWGMQKNRNNMTYEKLSRALRYYYRMNIIEKVPGRRLTYRFMHPPDEIKVERASCRYRPEKPTSSHKEHDKQDMTSLGSSEDVRRNSSPSVGHLGTSEVLRSPNLMAMIAAAGRSDYSPQMAFFNNSMHSRTYDDETKSQIGLNDNRTSPLIRQNGDLPGKPTPNHEEPEMAFFNNSLHPRTYDDDKSRTSPQIRQNGEDLPQDLSIKTEASSIKQEEDI